MSRGYAWALAILALTVLTLVAFFAWHTRPVTRFAPGFNSRAFHALAPGTPADQVIQRVGPPLAFVVDRSNPSLKDQWRSFDFVSLPHLLQKCGTGGRAQLI